MWSYTMTDKDLPHVHNDALTNTQTQAERTTRADAPSACQPRQLQPPVRELSGVMAAAFLSRSSCCLWCCRGLAFLSRYEPAEKFVQNVVPVAAAGLQGARPAATDSHGQNAPRRWIKAIHAGWFRRFRDPRHVPEVKTAHRPVADSQHLETREDRRFEGGLGQACWRRARPRT